MLRCGCIYCSLAKFCGQNLVASIGIHVIRKFMRGFRAVFLTGLSWSHGLCLHWHKKSDFLLTSDTDRNLLHTCKYKNPRGIRFFRIRSEPLPNVDFNQIHIQYLDIRLTSKHTYLILHRTPNARTARLLIKIFNGVLIPACCMRSHFIEMETFYR